MKVIKEIKYINKIKKRQEIKLMKIIILIFPLCMLISSCAGLNSQFDCAMKPGIRCESIDSINARVDRGEIGSGGLSDVSDPKLSQMPIYKNTHRSLMSLTKGESHRGGPLRGEPLRYGETVQRVWVAPFEDKQGNYHQESEIFTVTNPGSWIGAPLKEKDETGE